MDPALRLGRGNPLDAMHAGLVLEVAEDAVALDGHARVLDPSRGVVARVHQGRLPPLPLRVTQVHAQKIGREEPCLVPAGAGTHLEDDAAIVVRIPGQEQDLQALVQAFEPRLRNGKLRPSHLAHFGVRVGEVRLPVRDLRAHPLVLAERLHQLLELRPLLRHLGEPAAVADHLGVPQVGGQPFEPLLDLLQLLFHVP